MVLLLLLLKGSGLWSQETFRDNFSTVSYSNNDGTFNFSGNWVESGDNNNPNSGRIAISGNRLMLQNLDNAFITRSLDLSGALSATLTFDFERTEGNERVSVQLFDGSNWNERASLNGSGTLNYNLSIAELSALAGIRLRTDSGNWDDDETMFIDNVLFTALYPVPNDPPVLTATGNQVYCPGGSLPVAETINITDPDDTTAFLVSVQISSGYVPGEDLLTLTGSHPSITPAWSPVEGKLTLTGPATLAEFEAAVLAVEYSSSAPTPSGSRGFSITVGDANYLPQTGHFYEFVAVPGITWTAARDAAALRTYYGLQGYLATLTSQVEADFSGSQALGVGWIGASDDATEGDWQWVTGPEAGTSFWSGGVGGTELTFAFWNANEPNDFPDGPVTPGQENFAHITDPSVTTSPGSWNDLPNAGGGGAYAPQGYVVEYGGMPGDPVLSISANTTITIDNIAPTASAPLPVTVYCPADIPAVDTSVVTDEADNCTPNPVVSFVGDASNGGTPEVISRTYRVSDAVGNFVEVIQLITIETISYAVQPTDQLVLVGANGIFSASVPLANSFQWQVSSNGGSSWTAVSDGPEYSGSATSTLTILLPGIDKNGYMFRVLAGNSASLLCPEVISASAVLTVNPSRVLTNRRITYRVNKG
jgi:hypothetical protein